MKTKICFVFLLFTILGLGYAQSGINYKALIKDKEGNVVANQTIDIQFIIEINDTEVYREAHKVITDNNGIAIVIIGIDPNLMEDFEAIDWLAGTAYLNIQIDFGEGFIDFGNSQFNQVPYAINALKSSGLNPIDEGNGVGFRLANRNAAFYGNIGAHAVDLSYSNSGLISKGALGINAFATGFFTEATGDYSTSMGHNTEASGDYSTSLGFNTETIGDYAFASGRNSSATGNHSTALGYLANASGESAIALGRDVTASGSYTVAIGQNATASGINAIAFGDNVEASGSRSVAMGVDTDASGAESTAMGAATFATGIRSTSMGINTIASGDGSTAIGSLTHASGNRSLATGFSTEALSWGETVIGANNTLYTPNSTTEWNNNDRLFVIGNSNSFSSRSNAMTVLKNGKIGIGTDTPEELLHISGGRLRIGSETIEDGGSDILAFSSSLVPLEDNSDRLGGPNRKWMDVWATDGTINTSDRREKKNIKALNYGLAEVLQLKSVSFNWKNKNNPDLKLGLIAQEVQTLIPEVVKAHIWEVNEESGKRTKKQLNRLGVYYSDLVPVLIKAIQEQNKIIESQGKDLEVSKNNYEVLSNRIEALEANFSN